jgi:hypothetical protein
MLTLEHYFSAEVCFSIAGVWGVLSLWRTELSNFKTRNEKGLTRVIGTIALGALVWWVIAVINTKRGEVESRNVRSTEETTVPVPNVPKPEAPLSPVANKEKPPQPKTKPTTDDSNAQISRAELQRMLQQFHSSGSDFANISNARLIEITKFAVFGLEELADIWQAEDSDTDRGASEYIRNSRFAEANGGSRSMNEIEIAKVRRDANQRKIVKHVRLRTEAKELIVQSDDLRTEIVHNRLSWELRDRKADSKQDAIFARLRTSNYDWKDVSQAHDYLSKLQKELEAQPRL